MNINTNTDIESQNENMYDYVNKNVLFNPILVGILFFVIVIYILLSYSLGSKKDNDIDMPFNISGYGKSQTTSTSSSSMKIIGLFVSFVFILLLITNSYFYYYGVSIMTSINDFLFGNNLHVNVYNNPQPSISSQNNNSILHVQNKQRPQVFNIPNNIYSYDDAKSVCKAYGGELATYNQIEDAYNKGASWCSQGWSEGQNVFYPTQESVFNDLQKIKGHEHDCGRIGINGGYISNPNARFGVNCYGYKPDMTPEEEYIMENKPTYPLTKEDIEFQKRVDYWKKNINDVIVSPFNPTTWSKI